MLAGALLLTFAFGSLHAFGALLQPLERWLDSGRGNVSLGYSLAIVALTAGVLLGPRVVRAIGASGTALVCAALGGLGLALPGLTVFLLGYGVFFGFANGMAYGLSLERAAAAVPGSKGLAIGMTTASYGCGAAVFAQIVGPVAADHSAGAALWFMALSVGVASLAAAAVLASMSKSETRPDGASHAASGHEGGGAVLTLGRLWLVYFLGASGGLMVTAHAVGILADVGASAALSRHSVTLNAVGNIVGSGLGGVLADRLRPTRALAAPLLTLIAAMSALLATSSGLAALAMLALCGLAYGALIAVVPVIVRKGHGVQRFGKAFGLVFTAWGAAGLAGPYTAGVLYDLHKNYSLANAAAIACALAALLVLVIPAVSAGVRGRGREPPAA